MAEYANGQKHGLPFTNALYADGGCVGRNPSKEAGVWSWAHTANNEFLRGHCGWVTPDVMGTKEVTNNQTEMLAMLYGLQALQPDWYGMVYSDSQVTLGRVFIDWRWKNIPYWMQEIYKVQRARLKNWDKIRWCLLAGHPTREQLAKGIGRNGLPVSIWNKWCDDSCQEAAADFRAKHFHIPENEYIHI